AAVRRIGEGAYQSRVPRPRGAELESLADSFNQMAAALQDQERERQDLVANFAHELRTPLANLQGYLQALRDGVMEPSPEIFGSLDEEVQRLLRLSRSLDVLARGSPPRGLVAPTADLVEVVEAAVRLCRPALDANQLDLALALPPTLRVQADPDRLAQVVLNLLQNAARYTPRGGLVRVTAEHAGDTAVVSVVNTGDGVPDGDLPFLFERFYRVEKSRDRSSGGAGVGLAIVKQLVEEAGGRVGVERRDGLVRFWFSLPRVPGDSPPASGSQTRRSRGMRPAAPGPGTESR
ncbi:MAG: HAMP domain-containing histidine kinase, partial [Candidatus Dormibacteraeota bacterium]|nr:HAMP domain-containing histidine kinase [Candidatus Dormibacteraeota bacterium]